MKLPVREFGTKDRHPLVLVHGLFGQGKNLSGLARSLSESRFVITVDLRNHGTADWHELHTYKAMADDLLETFDDFLRIDIMGHSMGGKAAMLAALTAPERIERLLIADIAPVAYDHSHLSYIEAMRALALDDLKSRKDADEALAIEDAGVRAFLLHSLDLKAQPPRWQFNLDALENHMSDITGWPENSNVFSQKTLFVGGKKSDYILAEHRDAIKANFPNAAIMHLKDAGHWLHAEQPLVFAKICQNFFT